MLLLIDNYDSFAYNLYQLAGAFSPDVMVERNDALTADEAAALAPEAIFLSPGPGRPEDAGVCPALVRRFAGKIPIFGVCLGMQVICSALGGRVSYARTLMHGKVSKISLEGESVLFRDMKSGFPAARYHSLAAVEESLPPSLRVTARAEDGEIMALEDVRRLVCGVQFHPESVMTPDGAAIVKNFYRCGEGREEIKMIKEAIVKLSKKEDLTFAEAREVMNEIMDGQASGVQMAAYLTALSLKGETTDEITASAVGMREHCIRLLHDVDALEIVGTGGDHANSFNISTTAALVTAAGGVAVAKHGNRAASSKCGAADVLEALGVNITISPERSAQLLKEINICFLFAQNYHIAMKYVAPVRRELGIRTVFNILGPLSNPAGAKRELMGVYDETLVEPLAHVMSRLGVSRGMVVFGQDSLDEISMSAPTTVCEIKDGWFQSYELTPERFGYERCDKSELAGGTPAENAAITRAILVGEDRGPKRSAVCLNAGAALYIGGKAESLEAGVRSAEEIIDSGAAMRKLEEFIRESNK